jgi:FkbM family methyltransferase
MDVLFSEDIIPLTIPEVDGKIFEYLSNPSLQKVIDFLINTEKYRTFIHIGFGYGKYVLSSMFNKYVKNIFCYDACLYFCSVLKKIIKWNREILPLKNIHIFNNAIGDRSGTAKVYIDPTDKYRSRLTPIDNSFEHNTEIYRLDDLDLGLDGSIFVLLDVEGYELKVFDGAKEFIKNNDINFIVEVWNSNIDTYQKYFENNHFLYNVFDEINIGLEKESDYKGFDNNNIEYWFIEKDSKYW